MPAHRLAAVSLLPVLLALGACSSSQLPQSGPVLSQSRFDQDFPQPPELAPAVDFWRNVYSKWGLGQIAIHDDRYLNLVYEVVDLPQPVSEGYTTSQRDFIREHYARWKDKISQIEQKRAQGLSLSADEQALAQKITQVAGDDSAISGAAQRLRYQRGLRERYKRGLEISGRYDALFRQEFRRAGLPEDLAFLPHVESSFQAHARSSVGATGMWQFTKGAAKTYMLNHPSIDERLDPVASARGAARYLGDAYRKLGSWPFALTSYNHGIGGMQKAKAQFGDQFGQAVMNYRGAAFGFASRNFYAEFLAARSIALQPQRYFPEGVNFQAPLNYDRVTLEQSLPLSELARFYRVESTQLSALNPAWTDSARSGRTALPSGSEVWLPKGTLAALGASTGDEVALERRPLDSSRTP